jgi:phage protein D
VTAGVTVMLEGWGGWDGKYIVKQAVHAVDSSGGYTTQIKLRRVLEGY